jgi:hypothetical protein
MIGQSSIQRNRQIITERNSVREPAMRCGMLRQGRFQICGRAAEFGHALAARDGPK